MASGCIDNNSPSTRKVNGPVTRDVSRDRGWDVVDAYYQAWMWYS
jgi:hypothetical protein